MSGADHGELNGAAGRASSKVAKEMGLEVGNDVSIASYTYRIMSITDVTVNGLMIAEMGHFVSSSRVVALDLRQQGWRKVS